MQAYSDWLYIVPWGLYKALIWTKEKFNNPVMLIGESGM
jgi:beta-glucosidase